MLKGIPLCLSPDLLKTLAEMGHGDRIVIADANFASASMSAGHRMIRADGISSFEILEAILQLMPLDRTSDQCVFTFGKKEGGRLVPFPVYDKYKQIIAKYEPEAAERIVLEERFDFYNLAKQAFAIVATGETEHYGCIILQKGAI